MAGGVAARVEMIVVRPDDDVLVGPLAPAHNGEQVGAGLTGLDERLSVGVRAGCRGVETVAASLEVSDQIALHDLRLGCVVVAAAQLVAGQGAGHALESARGFHRRRIDLGRRERTQRRDREQHKRGAGQCSGA